VFILQETTSLLFCFIFDAAATYLTNGTSSLTKASGRIPGAKSFVSDSSFINTLQVTSLVCKKIIEIAKLAIISIRFTYLTLSVNRSISNWFLNWYFHHVNKFILDAGVRG
jgi:hypothetical protein